MFPNSTFADWEDLVKKQLKTDDIYAVLNKANLEGITIKPIYDDVKKPLATLPRIEENMVLVSDYQEELGEDVFAVVLKQNQEGLTNKTIFVDNKDYAEHILTEESNRYISLVDVFSKENGAIDDKLYKELEAKNFERAIGIDAAFIQNAGGSIAQQLAVALLKTKELTDTYGEDVLADITIRVAVGPNYFFEIAKLRALKLLFNQLTKEYNKEQLPYIFAETSLRNKTNIDEENNLIRSTIELAAAMVGGADAVYSNNFKLKNATELSSEISFKQLIVLAYESIINVFEDAANGSYYIEDVTQQICNQAWEQFLTWENEGGYSALMANGTIQKAVVEHAIEEQKWVENGRIKLVGVNIYPQLEAKKSVDELYDIKVLKPVRWAEMYE